MTERTRRALPVLGCIVVMVAVLAIAWILFPFEPAAITHAQTPATGPLALPPTGIGAASDVGLGLAPWIALLFAGAVALGMAMFLAARRSGAQR